MQSDGSTALELLGFMETVLCKVLLLLLLLLSIFLRRRESIRKGEEKESREVFLLRRTKKKCWDYNQGEKKPVKHSV